MRTSKAEATTGLAQAGIGTERTRLPFLLISTITHRPSRLDLFQFECRDLAAPQPAADEQADARSRLPLKEGPGSASSRPA